MALWELDEFATPQFLGYVRSVPAPEAFSAARYLPNQTTFDISVEYIKGALNRSVMANVIAWDAEAPIGGKPGLGEKIQFELPPIKRKERVSEKEILRFLTPRAGTPDEQVAIEEVYAITRRLLDSVQARVEWLRMQALSEPTLSYSEDGVQIDFDYGLNANLINIDVSTTADYTGQYWDTVASANPIADLQKMAQDYEDETGYPLDKVVVSKKVEPYLLRNDAMRTLVRGSGAPTAQLAPAEVQTLFDIYSLPRLEYYDVKVWQEDADGSISEKRPLDYHKGVGLPSFPVGNTLWGPTAESYALFGSALAQEAPGIWANVYGYMDPVSAWVKSAGVALPSLPEAEKIMQVEVLSSGV